MKLKKIKLISNDYYYIFVDDEKYRLNVDTLIKYNLLKPRELSDEELKNALEYDDFYKGYLICIKYLSFKMRSEKEIIIKLKNNNISSSNYPKIIAKLKEQGYLNGDKYVTSYINEALKLSFKGPVRIKNELEALGYSSSKINKYLDEVPNEEWKDRVNKYILKKSKTFKGSIKKEQSKLYAELVRLGYEKSMLTQIDTVDFNDDENLKKDREKATKMLSRKYEGETLKNKVNQKLYSLGYSYEQIKKSE